MLVVQKFGGTSVGTVERIREVATRCIATQRQGHDVVVIVCAMSRRDQPAPRLAHEVNDDPPPDERELDVIAATGRAGLRRRWSRWRSSNGGRRAQSFLGSQVRILTDSAFTKARIKSIDGAKSHEALDAGQDRRRRRLPGHRRGRQHHHARPRRLGHHGRRHRRGAQGRRLRDLHRRRRRLHHRPEHLPERAQDRAHQLRGDARAGVARRQGAADPHRSSSRMKYGVPIHVRSCFNDNEGTWVVPEEKQMEDGARRRRRRATRTRRRSRSSASPTSPGVVGAALQPLRRRTSSST